MKRILSFIAVAFVLTFVGSNVVLADEFSVSNVTELNEKLASAKDGDVLVLADGSYNVDLVLTSSVTIKGTSTENTIINGSITIGKADINVTLDTLSVTKAGTIIKVDAKSTVNLNKVNAFYAGYTDTFERNSADGVFLTKNGNGSIVNITDSKIVAKYAIWVNGEENTVNINSSVINGWSAIDISNGSSSVDTAKNNKVIVNDSEIIGTNVYNGSTDSYGVIVVGGQENLILDIKESTVKNEFPVEGNVMDVILISDSYVVSKNTDVTITKTDLINNDAAVDGSAIINYSSEDIQKENNIIKMNETTITSANDLVYNVLNDYVTLTLVNEGESSIYVLPLNTSVSEDLLKVAEVEGYTFDGWFIDEEFKTAFDSKTLLDGDLTLYAKFTKKVEDPVIDKPVVDEPTVDEPVVEEPVVENPSTNDNIVMYVVASLISIIGIGGVGYYFKKKLVK